VLGRSKLSLRRLLDLDVGDVLTLGTSEGVSLPVFVEGLAKFTGLPKVSGGSLAIEIDRGPLEEIRRPFEQQPLNPMNGKSAA
jgi:flagellar motor switch protein FliM